MAKAGVKSVDDYIASQPEAVQGVLERAPGRREAYTRGSEESAICST